MIKVDQTKLHDPENGINGNCFAACISCFTEIPIEDIPKFEDSMYGKKDSYKGLDWPANALQWAKDVGWEWMDIPNHAEGYYMVCGETKRGLGLHQVVYKDGALWHDPHPDKSGLTKINHFESFNKIP